MYETTATEAEVVADLARRAAEPLELAAGTVFVANDPTGARVFDTDRYAATPRRKTGVTVVRDAASLVAVVAKHRTPDTEIYSDVEALTVTAVLNANGDELPGWADHRARLSLRHTPAWKEWTARNDKWSGQTDFAEFIEQHLADIADPAGADLLELAQTFKATKAVNFESSQRLSTGEVQLVYKEEISANAGKRGQISIPETFTLGLIPFEGAKTYRVTARLRYRIAETNLLLGYVLDRPDDVVRTAFDDVLADVTADLEIPVWNGTPA